MKREIWKLIFRNIYHCDFFAQNSVLNQDFQNNETY